MENSRFLRIFKPNPPRRYGLIPTEKGEDSSFKNLFRRKNDESAANREYVCPFTYCDPYVAEGRRITGVRQYPVEKEKSLIDILHERKMSLFYGTPEEDPNYEYDRPYIGGVFDHEKAKEEEKMKKKEEKKMKKKMKKKEGKRVKRKQEEHEEHKMKEKEEENMSWDEV